jgi:UDP:flavonoid glycosyltransferase YjiC (YdhE family)
MDAAFPGRVGLTGPAAIRYDLSAIFLRPARAQLEAVDAALAEEPVDAVLSESMFMGTALLLTRPRAARPSVLNLGMVPLGSKSADTAPFGLGVPPLPGPVGRIRNAVLTVVAERFLFAPLQKEWVALVADSTGERTSRFVLDWPASADAIVQFTVPSFEYPRPDLSTEVHFVGPVSRSLPSDTPLPEWWSDLDASRPVVHVTQGTIANKDYAELIEPTISGLADDEVLVVVSTGGRPIDTLPHPLPANVRAASYLPYDKLLPLTDVMVTNGGYGGVHYALEHGVPLVVAGATEDKVEVTARVAWAGVGINLRTNRPKAPAVASAVRRVISTPGYRAASAAIGTEIESTPGPAGVVAAIESVATLPRPQAERPTSA